MKPILPLVIFIVFWLIFAVVKEKSYHEHSYAAAKTRDVDSIQTSLRKIRYCMTYELRTVKWRRSLLSAAAASFLLFAVCWRRFPTPAEMITHLLILTLVFSVVWNDFSSRTATGALRHCDSNANNIKRLLKENRRFILPSWLEVL